MKNFSTLKMIGALMVLFIMGGSAFAQSLNFSPPVFINTGNLALDAANYSSAKLLWLNAHNPSFVRSSEMPGTRNSEGNQPSLSLSGGIPQGFNANSGVVTLDPTRVYYSQEDYNAMTPAKRAIVDADPSHFVLLQSRNN